MKNIQAAMQPLSITLCLLGYGVFEYPQGRPRTCLTILYILILWLPYAFITFEMSIFLKKFRIMFPITIAASNTFTVVYMLFNLYYNKKFKDCLNKLNIVNDTLEKCGTPKNYKELHMWSKWLIVGWIISIFIMDVLDSLWLIGRIPTSYTKKAIYLTFITSCTYHINTLRDGLFIILLRYIGSQFECINRQIQEISEQKKRRVRYAWSNSTSPLIRRQIDGTKTSKQLTWILMHVHFELCSITRKLNIIFGFQTVLQTTILQIFTVQLVIYLYDSVMMISTHSIYQMKIDILIILIWVINNIAKIIVFNYTCEEICTKAHRTQIFLNRLTNLILDGEMRDNITQFLLQLLRNPLQISGLGFYYYGYNFLQWFVQNIASIIIIVIQGHP